MTGPLDALDDLDRRRKKGKDQKRRPREGLDLDGAWAGEGRD